VRNTQLETEELLHCRECVNREDIYCEIIFDNKRDVARIAIENLININFGEEKQESGPREKEVKKEVTAGVSYSAILQKPKQTCGTR
jgi:hypothetical protein